MTSIVEITAQIQSVDTVQQDQKSAHFDLKEFATLNGTGTTERFRKLDNIMEAIAEVETAAVETELVVWDIRQERSLAQQTKQFGTLQDGLLHVLAWLKFFGDGRLDGFPTIINVNIRILKPGVHEVTYTVFSEVSLAILPPNGAHGAEFKQQQRWKITGANTGNGATTTITASSESQHLQYGSGTTSLFFFNLMPHEESQYRAPSVVITFSVENIRFFNMSRVLTVQGANERQLLHQRAEIFIKSCTFEKMSSNLSGFATVEIRELMDGATLKIQDSAFTRCNSRGLKIRNGADHSLFLENVTMANCVVSNGGSSGAAMTYVSSFFKSLLLSLLYFRMDFTYCTCMLPFMQCCWD